MKIGELVKINDLNEPDPKRMMGTVIKNEMYDVQFNRPGEEIQQVDKMIKSYKRTIKYIRNQILDLERKKLKDPVMEKFDFNITTRKIKK